MKNKFDFLFFSDLHLHDRKEFSRVDPETGLNTRLSEGLSVLDQIINICKESDIRYVVYLGDWFERKDNLPNHVLIEFKNRLKRFFEFGINVISLCGNHDFNLPNYPIVTLFDNPKFVFISRPTLVPGLPDISFIPFQRKWEDFVRAWEDSDSLEADIVCVHQEIPGAVYETGKEIEGEWNLKTNPKILYLSGHLHRPQKAHGIQFLGSPYQIKFSDEGQDRFVWLYDSSAKSMKSIQLKYSKFVSLEYYELGAPNPKDTEDFVKGNYVKIVGEVLLKDFDQKRKIFLKELLEKSGAKAVVFDIKIKRPSQSKISESIVDNDPEIIRDYAKRNGEGLDIDRLTKMGLDVYENL